MQVRFIILLIHFLILSNGAIADSSFRELSLPEWSGEAPFYDEIAPNPKKLLELTHEDIESISPEAMRNRAIFLENNFRKYHCFNGMVWKGFFNKNTDPHPYCFDVGSDSAIFTGYYLAAATYRYLATQKEEDLDKVLGSIRGFHILTHISGSPGVLVRSAFPIGEANLWRIEGNETHLYDGSDNIPDVFGKGVQTYPPMRFYARATRDQLTGVLYGLAVAWTELFKKSLDPAVLHPMKIHKALEVLYEITESLYKRIRVNAYVLRDHLGKTGTTANKVEGILRLQLLALYRRVLLDERTHDFRPVSEEAKSQLKKKIKKIRREYRRYFPLVFLKGALADKLYPLSNLHQYYAWNLRWTRFYSLFILETNSGRKRKLFEKIRNDLWEASLLFTGKSVQYHQNTYFTFLYWHILTEMWGKTENVLEKLHINHRDPSENPELQIKRLQEAVWSLKALAIRPLRNWPSPLANKFLFPYQFVPVHLRKPSQHFLWHLTPFGNKAVGTDRENGLLEATGVDFLLTYWMGQAKLAEWVKDFSLGSSELKKSPQKVKISKIFDEDS